MHAGFPVQQSAAVGIQFIPGRPGESRLEGHSYAISVYIFFGSVAAVGFFVFRFWQFYKS